VLVGGRRRRLAGAVSMDQIVVDCGPAGSSPPVSVGDEVVLIGCQGAEEITAAEWAERLGVIVYEVLCGIGPRVPRVYVG
jgi:alanine racemase